MSKTPLLVLMALLIAACGAETATDTPVLVTTPAPTALPAPTDAPGSTDIADAPRPTTTSAPIGTDIYKVGDVIDVGDLVLFLVGWDSPPGSSSNEPDEGNIFVIVDMLLVNTGTGGITINSPRMMELRDDTGQEYEVDSTASIVAGRSGPDGKIDPGERRRGSVGYQVPQDATGLRIVVDTGVFGKTKILAHLGPEPVAVGLPEELVGEHAQDMSAVGDVSQGGDLAVTVNGVTYPAGDDANAPDEGNKFVVVDVTLENAGSKNRTVSSLEQMQLKDATGQVYNLDVMASDAAGGSTPDGQIVPGATLQGQVGYQVPEGAEGLVFMFDPGLFGVAKVFVALGP